VTYIEMSTNNDLTWTEVVARGNKAKVISPLRSGRHQTFEDKLVGEVLFDHPDLSRQILAQKAASIVQQALTPGSVLFAFPLSTFPDRVDAHTAIETQLGKTIGFRPISRYSTRTAANSFLIEAVFEQNESTIKAINEGLTHNGFVYKGSPSIDNAQGSMTRVQLDVLRIAKAESLKDDLLRSLGHYGQVYQIKQYKYRNYFEGQITILIDTSKRGLVEDATDVAIKPQPLTRMMYLDAWDIYVPASFKGAPPVCFYYRQSGHIHAKCPELACRECFQCGKTGHTKRYCMGREESDEGGSLDTYIRDIRNQKQKEAKKAELTETMTTDDEDVEPISSMLVDEELVESVSTCREDEKIDSAAEAMIVENINEDDEDDAVERRMVRYTPNGTYVSRHAPANICSTMDVDQEGSVVSTAKDMLAITAVSKHTKDKRFRLTKVGPSNRIAPVASSGIKKVNSYVGGLKKNTANTHNLADRLNE
jgi:hypothetical protein